MNQTPQMLTRSQVTEFVSLQIVKASAAVLPLLVVGVVQGFRLGWTWRYLLLSLGAVSSFVLLSTYAIVVVTQKRSWLSTIAIFSGLVPYIFGCYLTFYEGLWRIRLLRHGFSLMVVLQSVAFIVAGYLVVAATYQLSTISAPRLE